MQIKGARRTLVILSLALAGCKGSIAPASPTPEVASIRLFTDTATMPLLRDLARHYHPAGFVITWDFQTGEASTLADWLKSPSATYAMVDYIPGTFNPSLWSTPVGQDGLAVVVHPSNRITNLTAEQLRAILQGRITNWKALNGPDVPMTVVARDPRSSAASIIQNIVLGDRQPTRSARLAPSDDAVSDLVGSDPGAIGYVSMNYLASNVHPVAVEGVSLSIDTVTENQYPLRAPIVLVGNAEPQNDPYRAFFTWIQSPDGQAIVRQHCGGLENQ